MKRSWLAVVVLLLLTFQCGESRAADPLEDFPDPAAAETLFIEAHTLMQQSRFSDACPKLEASLRLVPKVATQAELADCNEHVGNVASAWQGYLELAERSKAAHDTEREKAARKRARALAARLPKLVIAVPNAAPGVEVKRDGVVIVPAAWGTEIPVDPGRHRVTVTVPGKRRWVTTVQSTEGTTTRVAVPDELAAAEEGPPPATPDEPRVAPPATTEPPTATEPTEPTSAAVPAPMFVPAPPAFPPPVRAEPAAKRRTLAWLVAGAGLVGLGVGTGFTLASLGAREDARVHCAGDACDATGVSLRDDAIRNGNIATVSTLAGAAALVGGLVLAFTGRVTHTPRAPEGRSAPKRVERRALASGQRQ